MKMCARCSTQYRPEEVPDGGFCVARPMIAKKTEAAFVSGGKTVVDLLEPDSRAMPCGGKIIEVQCSLCLDQKKVYIKDPQNDGEIATNCPRGCANK